MTIGVDGNEANLKNRVGVNQYAAELLCALEKLEEAQKHEWVVYLASPPLPHLPKERVGWTYKIVPGGLIQKTLTVWRTRPDVYFAPTHYLPLFPPVSTVMAVMDLGYLRFPDQFKKRDFFQLKYWTLISLLEAQKVLAISESTKSDIIKHYPWAKRKIVVTPLGYDKSQFKYPIPKKEIEKVAKKYGIEGKYVLYLGTLKPSKNIEGVVEAFHLLITHRPSLATKLVVAGKKGWLFNTIFKKVEELGLQNRVIFTDFFHEEDKAPLMAGALVFVSPSFWEGFGIPALESMAVGTPVVVSNVTSYPEVVGKAGILVDPYNVEGITEGINKVVSASSAAYDKMIRTGLDQAAKFSWEETARKTLDVLTNL
ncbi:MAG: hypothetical protein A2782_03405 [Candidatus Blackburnbacteria bacterium RIFCSPHIGHO2_01_FULL_43_15b]|uniref:Glycosyl transferase family 1 domain-containing protein n=1 Tax=Candidatus Blackburnbacteria bacterium RIFCSPHIGHO2_01_FULL_43_15b TaxID=1797513 RepID=A0A1G1V2J5_9BACT|nr:MAG: hypothetical protein A2782_03405 [Candidatus Blackburnbacteria bacterium RIFCSPHIGHO2_01_FULL_43_15b]